MLNPTSFIRANTTLLPVPLTPEIQLHLAHEAVPLWQKTEEELGEIGLPPPFWAFAWAGGQALARYVLDHPEMVLGQRVVDIASGSGLVAIAAMKAGAAHVLAADIDVFAVAAMQLNIEHNLAPEARHSGGSRNLSAHKDSGFCRHDSYGVTGEDLLLSPPPNVDVILVGDLFYEKTIAEIVFNWITRAHANGTKVLVGDPGRSYFPKDKMTKLAEYNVPVTRDLEDAEIKRTAVWTLV